MGEVREHLNGLSCPPAGNRLICQYTFFNLSHHILVTEKSVGIASALAAVHFQLLLSLALG